MGIFRRKATAKSPTPAEDLSFSAKQVMRVYLEVPEANRPAYDLEAMLRALDLKYGSLADYHVRVHTDFGAETVALGDCTCVCSYDLDGLPEERPHSTCEAPEYYELLTALIDVRFALITQERELERQRHEAKVAGVAYELADVAALTAALRQERDLIDSVTEELARTAPRYELEASR